MLAEAVPSYKDLFSKRVTTPSALSKIGSFIKHDEGPFSALAKPFDEEEVLENSQAMHLGSRQVLMASQSSSGTRSGREWQAHSC